MSTRGADGSDRTFCDVVLDGLAPDGGLYVMSDSPASFTRGQLERLVPLSYADRALRILEQWINPSHLHPSLLRQMTHKAYNIDSFDCNKVCACCYSVAMCACVCIAACVCARLLCGTDRVQGWQARCSQAPQVQAPLPKMANMLSSLFCVPKAFMEGTSHCSCLQHCFSFFKLCTFHKSVFHCFADRAGCASGRESVHVRVVPRRDRLLQGRGAAADAAVLPPRSAAARAANRTAPQVRRSDLDPVTLFCFGLCKMSQYCLQISDSGCDIRRHWRSCVGRLRKTSR